MEIIPIEVVAGFGIFLGCLGRAMFPFLRKQAEAAERNETIRWERRYWWTLGFSIVIAFVATMMILPGFEIPGESVFPVAFLEGWAIEDIVNKVAK